MSLISMPMVPSCGCLFCRWLRVASGGWVGGVSREAPCRCADMLMHCLSGLPRPTGEAGALALVNAIMWLLIRGCTYHIEAPIEAVFVIDCRHDEGQDQAPTSPHLCVPSPVCDEGDDNIEHACAHATHSQKNKCVVMHAATHPFPCLRVVSIIESCVIHSRSTNYQPDTTPPPHTPVVHMLPQ